VAAGVDSKFVTNDVTHDPRVHNHAWAEELGLVSFAGYRLLSPQGEPVGVLALFSQHVITPEEDALLESIANTTAQLIPTTEAEQHQTFLLEKLEATNKELTDFAYIVSHDLKAPLRGIKALTDWIVTDYSDKLDDDGREKLALLSGRVNRMHNLIDGILQYSRVGHVQEERTTVDLHTLVDEVIDLLGVPDHIHITIEGELPTVTCQRIQIGQVFQNLLSNAVKYMDKPQGRITIACMENENQWEFRICDNGPGIEAQFHETIFLIFQTLVPKDQYDSTGVGLSVVKRIVENNGGKIWVESEVNEGSTFLFTLPKYDLQPEDKILQASTV
jgi:light-regulated signal transduction histidine kinase (bacteriophytochrome)